MQIIKVKNDLYEEYKMLLLKRDQYQKDAVHILISYTRRFGDLISSIFRCKIECIRIKKEIALCQAFINRGEPIDMTLSVPG